jgi:hypothetical protein
MGRSRYDDRELRVDSRELIESERLHRVSEQALLTGPTILPRSLLLQVCEVLDATAIELSHGRAVPISLRRAARSIAVQLEQLVSTERDRVGPR